MRSGRSSPSASVYTITEGELETMTRFPITAIPSGECRELSCTHVFDESATPLPSVSSRITTRSPPGRSAWSGLKVR